MLTLIQTYTAFSQNTSSLIEAIKTDHYNSVKQYLKKQSKKESKKKFQNELNQGCDNFSLNSTCPLYNAAVIQNNISITNLLLQYGANPNAENSIGETILFRLRGDQGAIAKVLIKYNAKVNHVSNTGYTPLFNAVNKKKSDLAEALVKRADVNHQLSDGTTALNGAILYGNTKIVQLLLQHGAKFNGAPSFHYAAGKQGALALANNSPKPEEMKETINKYYQS
jgi:ankyrin repeat protein